MNSDWSSKFLLYSSIIENMVQGCLWRIYCKRLTYFRIEGELNIPRVKMWKNEARENGVSRNNINSFVPHERRGKKPHFYFLEILRAVQQSGVQVEYRLGHVFQSLNSMRHNTIEKAVAIIKMKTRFIVNFPHGISSTEGKTRHWLLNLQVW